MNDKKPIEVFKPVIYEDSIAEVIKILRSGWIGAGPVVTEFEERFSHFIGSKYCVSVSSGSAALHIAMKSLGLPANSKVMVSAINHISTINAILYENCIPVFADVEPRTGNLSVEGARKMLTDDVKAIVCTHMGGYPCDLDGLRDLAHGHGIPLVEDCAHAIGASYKGDLIGKGDICCFSFSFPKAITGIEGGSILTDSDEYAESARALGNLGMGRGEKYSESTGAPPRVGLRYSWNDVMASIALKQLGHTENDNRRRKWIAEKYLKELGEVEGVYLPEYKKNRASSYFFVPIFFERRDVLANRLIELGIRTRVYFRYYYSIYGMSTGNLPNAEWYGRHELTLPLNISLGNEELDYIISTIKEGW
jgi:UDP-4-amino-4-deoxy-L-arabinose-oxoglutarate aminotransferase